MKTKFPNKVFLEMPTVEEWAKKLYVTTSVYYTYMNPLLRMGFIRGYKDGQTNNVHFKMVLPFPNPPDPDIPEPQDEASVFLKKMEVYFYRFHNNNIRKTRKRNKFDSF